MYLDSAATSQKPRAVIDAEVAFLTNENAAVHRGAHTLAAEATELFEDARATVAGFVGAAARAARLDQRRDRGPQPRRVRDRQRDARSRRRRRARGSRSPRRRDRRHRDRAPREPRALAGARGAHRRVLRHIPVHDDGQLDLDAAASVIGERTALVAFTHVSNVLGIVNPVAELVALAHAVGALTVLDACQSAPHLPLDLPALGVDLAVFSGHKMLGPYGIGGLYGRARRARGAAAVPHRRLDDHPRRPGPRRVPPAAAAFRGRHAAGLAGDRAWPPPSATSTPSAWMPSHAHERLLERRLRDGSARDRGRAAARRDARSIASASRLRRRRRARARRRAVPRLRGIAVRVGHHCAAPLHARFGLTASVRASTALYNTTDEVDQFLDAARPGAAVLRSRRMSGLESLYQELILEHSKRPDGKGIAAPRAPRRPRTSATRSAATRSPCRCA